MEIILMEKITIGKGNKFLEKKNLIELRISSLA